MMGSIKCHKEIQWIVVEESREREIKGEEVIIKQLAHFSLLLFRINPNKTMCIPAYILLLSHL
jgi:hypothetical protein